MSPKNQPQIFLILIAVATLVGCVKVSTSLIPTLPATSIQVDNTPTLESQSTEPTRPLELEPSPTKMPTAPQPMPTSNDEIKQCSMVSTDPNQGIVSEGAVILEGNDNVYVLSSKNQQVLPVSNLESDERIYFPKVSPDGSWLQFNLTKYDKKGIIVEEKLVLLSSDLQAQESFLWEENWSDVIGWLDNARLVILSKALPTGAIVIFNPFSNHRQVLLPTFPDIYDVSPSTTGWNFARVVYDPTLTRVTYLNGEQPQASIVFWDLQNSKELWSLQDWRVTMNQPQWSPDGMQLVVVVPSEGNLDYFEFLSINHKGEVTSLWKEAIPYPVNYSVPFTWSQDGKYIAFWLNNNEENRLMFLVRYQKNFDG